MKNQKEHQKNPDFVFHSKPSDGIERRHTIVGVKIGESATDTDGAEVITLAIGHAVVADNDVFKKRLGVSIATGRARLNPFEEIKLRVKPNKEGEDKASSASSEFFKYCEAFKYNHPTMVVNPHKHKEHSVFTGLPQAVEA